MKLKVNNGGQCVISKGPASISKKIFSCNLVSWTCLGGGGGIVKRSEKSKIDIIALNDRSTTREVRFQVSVQLKAPL